MLHSVTFFKATMGKEGKDLKPHLQLQQEM